MLIIDALAEPIICLFSHIDLFKRVTFVSPNYFLLSNFVYLPVYIIAYGLFSDHFEPFSENCRP